MTAAPLDLEVEGAEAHGLDPGALRALARAVLAAEGVGGPARSASRSSARARCARSTPSTATSTRSPTCSPSRSTASTSCRPGLERQLGDVVVCFEQAARQAAEAGVETRAEVRTLVVHGLLHLLGHDHEADAGEMLARQDELIAVLPAAVTLPARCGTVP